MQMNKKALFAFTSVLIFSSHSTWATEGSTSLQTSCALGIDNTLNNFVVDSAGNRSWDTATGRYNPHNLFSNKRFYSVGKGGTSTLKLAYNGEFAGCPIKGKTLYFEEVTGSNWSMNRYAEQGQVKVQLSCPNGSGGRESSWEVVETDRSDNYIVTSGKVSKTYSDAKYDQCLLTAIQLTDLSHQISESHPGYVSGGDGIDIRKLKIHYSNHKPVAEDDSTILKSAAVTASGYTGAVSYTTKLENNHEEIYNDTDAVIVNVGNKGDYAVGWRTTYGLPHEGASIQLFNADGSLKANIVDFEAKGYVLGIDIASLNDAGDFVVVWAKGNGTTAELTAYTQRFQADGTAVGNPISLGGARQGSVNVEVLNGDVYYAWQLGGSHIYKQVIKQDGSTDGKEFVGYGQAPNIVPIDGGYIFSWFPSYTTTRTQKFDLSGNQIGSDLTLNVGHVQTRNAVDIAVLGTTGHYAVAGSVSNGVIKSYRVDEQNRLVSGSEKTISESGSSSNNQVSVSVTSGSGEYVVAWQGIKNSKWVTYSQHFSASGVADTPLNAIQGGGHSHPQVTGVGDSGDYVLTWSAISSDGSYHVYVQKYNSDGSTDGPRHTLTGEQANKNDLGAVVTSVTSDGSYAVAFHGVDTYNGDYSIYVAHVDANNNVKASYPTGSTGDFTISVNITAPSEGHYLVTYSTGVLWAGDPSTSYPSGSKVPASDWVNVKLKGAEGAKLDLVVQVSSSIETEENKPLVIPVKQLLNNDSDVDGDPISLHTFDSQATYDGSAAGSVVLSTVSGKQVLTYTPNSQMAELESGESALVTFNYTIKDSNGAKDSAEVTIKVNGL